MTAIEEAKVQLAAAIAVELEAAEADVRRAIGRLDAVRRTAAWVPDLATLCRSTRAEWDGACSRLARGTADLRKRLSPGGEPQTPPISSTVNMGLLRQIAK